MRLYNVIGATRVASSLSIQRTGNQSCQRHFRSSGLGNRVASVTFDPAASVIELPALLSIQRTRQSSCQHHFFSSVPFLGGQTRKARRSLCVCSLPISGRISCSCLCSLLLKQTKRLVLLRLLLSAKGQVDVCERLPTVHPLRNASAPK